MDLADRMKDIKDKVADAALEHEEQIRRAVDKAEAAANEKSGGQYSEQIRKAGAKAEEMVDRLTAEKKSRP